MPEGMVYPVVAVHVKVAHGEEDDAQHPEGDGCHYLPPIVELGVDKGYTVTRLSEKKVNQGQEDEEDVDTNGDELGPAYGIVVEVDGRDGDNPSLLHVQLLKGEEVKTH